MRKIFWLGIVAFAVAGCRADPGLVGVAGVREAAAGEVAQCAYIADFRMTPGVYGALAAQGVAYARNKILADIRDAGGNAAVFDPVTPGAAVLELHAVGYRC